MDLDVVEQFRQAGIDPSLERTIPRIAIRTDEARRPIHIGGAPVLVASDERSLEVDLKSLPTLFSGSALPPSAEKDLQTRYVPFFAILEQAALDYCHTARRKEWDEEFERLYRLLWRRPEGTDKNPLFSHLQAAARLYLSLRDTSRDEFEAVVKRLAKSARRFSSGAGSTNYVEMLSGQFN